MVFEFKLEQFDDGFQLLFLGNIGHNKVKSTKGRGKDMEARRKKGKNDDISKGDIPEENESLHFLRAICFFFQAL